MQGFELAAISVAVADIQNFFEVATGHRRNAGIRAGGHLGGDLGFAKLFPGALASTQGASRERKKFRAGSFESALVLQTERLHIYNGFCGPEASYTVNMQSLEPSHGTP